MIIISGIKIYLNIRVDRKNRKIKFRMKTWERRETPGSKYLSLLWRKIKKEIMVEERKRRRLAYIGRHDLLQSVTATLWPGWRYPQVVVGLGKRRWWWWWWLYIALYTIISCSRCIYTVAQSATIFLFFFKLHLLVFNI